MAAYSGFANGSEFEEQNTRLLAASLDRFEAVLYGELDVGAPGTSSEASSGHRRCRMPDDRQVCRPVQDQCAEWTALRTYLRIRGHQLVASKESGGEPADDEDEVFAQHGVLEEIFAIHPPNPALDEGCFLRDWPDSEDCPPAEPSDAADSEHEPHAASGLPAIANAFAASRRVPTGPAVHRQLTSQTGDLGASLQSPAGLPQTSLRAARVPTWQRWGDLASSAQQTHDPASDRAEPASTSSRADSIPGSILRTCGFHLAADVEQAVHRNGNPAADDEALRAGGLVGSLGSSMPGATQPMQVGPLL
ncbi:hypothetical protein WJX72_007989 [[Myrmecia] bisecta]|uniref:Uncharacterized protein n=1 Tax=[Myrmecia] bisecta TaxID=41462 RepID=A0AAW1PX46_9CHLO